LWNAKTYTYFPPLIEETHRRARVIRDLKGIVDRKRYTTRNRMPEPRKIPSLRRLNMLEIIHLPFPMMTEGKLWISQVL
jgi:hypothetical protein